ncbi:hypothetical protein EW026_g6697 [Hermanssonia centrifuga]|uniref:Uncharacterized protein n=1 Tax=Hermanssonia centrifuga TaxID=98765 RepID=A0A4S4KA75_9APHY|nr:hypothetical protein EW026_g6697 [Hermanssonia centrifuga]
MLLLRRLYFFVLMASSAAQILVDIVLALISRFILNLLPGFRVPTISSIIGNFGEDLDHGPGRDESDEAIPDRCNPYPLRGYGHAAIGDMREEPRYGVV